MKYLIMKKTILLLLVSLMMACIGTGCSEEEDYGYHIKGDKLVCTQGGREIKYSPRDIKDYPDFLNVEAIEASDDYYSWYGCCIWTGICEGNRYYVRTPSMFSSQAYGYYYTETGEVIYGLDFKKWTDIEVIYIHPKYIEYCKNNKHPLEFRVPWN